MVSDLFTQRVVLVVLFTHRRYKRPGRLACCSWKWTLSIILGLGCKLSVRGAASPLYPGIVAKKLSRIEEMCSESILVCNSRYDESSS